MKEKTGGAPLVPPSKTLSLFVTSSHVSYCSVTNTFERAAAMAGADYRAAKIWDPYIQFLLQQRKFLDVAKVYDRVMPLILENHQFYFDQCVYPSSTLDKLTIILGTRSSQRSIRPLNSLKSRRLSTSVTNSTHRPSTAFVSLCYCFLLSVLYLLGLNAARGRSHPQNHHRES